MTFRRGALQCNRPIAVFPPSPPDGACWHNHLAASLFAFLNSRTLIDLRLVSSPPRGLAASWLGGELGRTSLLSDCAAKPVVRHDIPPRLAGRTCHIRGRLIHQKLTGWGDENDTTFRQIKTCEISPSLSGDRFETLRAKSGRQPSCPPSGSFDMGTRGTYGCLFRKVCAIRIQLGRL